MNTNSDRRQFYEKFKEDKEYRDSFIAEHIYTRLPLKIRGLREQRGWSQKDLGEKVSMAQAWVSRLEDPSYGKFTIATLLRLASAFDVGLDIDFRLFSEILDKALTLTPESFVVASFVDDPGFVEYRTSTAAGSADTLATTRSHRVHPAHGVRHKVTSGLQTGRVTTADNTANPFVLTRPEKDEIAKRLGEFTLDAHTAV